MMFVVNAVTRLLKAKAMTRPTATTTTSPRITKFLKPLSIRTVLLKIPDSPGRDKSVDRRAYMPDADHISSGHGSQGPTSLIWPLPPHRPQNLTCSTQGNSRTSELAGCGRIRRRGEDSLVSGPGPGPGRAGPRRLGEKRACPRGY